MRRSSSEQLRAAGTQVMQPSSESTSTSSQRRRSADAMSTLEQFQKSGVRVERCPDCGCEMRYPSLGVRYVYQDCPYCQYQLEPPTTLSIPPPHPEIPDFNQDTLCMARVFNKGKGGHCTRARKRKSQYCSTHQRMSLLPGGLTYGRIDEPYCKPLPLGASVNESKESNEQSEMQLTHDARVIAAKVAAAAQPVEDAVVLDRARVLVQTKMNRSQVTTELMYQHLDPTFGMKIRDDPAKQQWLKNNVQALLALPVSPFSVLAAAYGHPTDASRAIDVSAVLTERLRLMGGSKLEVTTEESLVSAFESEGLRDPCPREDKLLRLRYSMHGRRGEVRLAIDGKSGRLRRPLMLELGSTKPRLTVVKATFGHPHDHRKQFDVTEQMQGQADLRGQGEFIEVSATEDANIQFGDPCPGIVKVLKVTYDLAAFTDDIAHIEAHNRLVVPVEILAPIVSPALVVCFATYAPRKARRRAGQGAGVRSANLMGKQAALSLMRVEKVQAMAAAKAPPSIRDVDLDTLVITDNVQRAVDASGGDVLALRRGEHVGLRFDVGRDPAPGAEKLLRIEYKLRDQRGEMRVDVDTDGNIVGGTIVLASNMDDGSTTRGARLAAKTKDRRAVDHTRMDPLTGLLVADARPVDPTVLVHGAVYGHPKNPALQVSVQEILENRVRQSAGRTLAITTEEDLVELFGDPCNPLGINKLLQIRYEIKRMSGVVSCEVNEHGRLRQSLLIGWPRMRYDWK